VRLPQGEPRRIYLREMDDGIEQNPAYRTAPELRSHQIFETLAEKKSERMDSQTGCGKSPILPCR
jgi:hypothetical protein